MRVAPFPRTESETYELGDKTYTVYSVARLFPLIEGAEFTRLVEDVRTHGVREPILVAGPDASVILASCSKLFREADSNPDLQPWDHAVAVGYAGWSRVTGAIPCVRVRLAPVDGQTVSLPDGDHPGRASVRFNRSSRSGAGSQRSAAHRPLSCAAERATTCSMSVSDLLANHRPVYGP